MEETNTTLTVNLQPTEEERVLSTIKVGDMLLVNSKGLLPRLIRYYMKRYDNKFCAGILDRYYNHMAVVVDMWGELHSADATAKGFQIRPLLQVYDAVRFTKEDNHVEVKRPVVEFTEDEKRLISEQAVKYSIVQTKYEFLNFLWWIVYITTNKRLFIGGNKDKKLFCFEGTSRCINAGRPMFLEPVLTTTPDVQYDERFTTIYV